MIDRKHQSHEFAKFFHFQSFKNLFERNIKYANRDYLPRRSGRNKIEVHLTLHLLIFPLINQTQASTGASKPKTVHVNY